MLLRRSPLALACVLLLASAGCGGGGDGGGSASGPDPAGLTPPDAVLYGEALVRPSGDVEAGVRTAIQRVARIEDPAAELRRLLEDDGDAETTFDRDIDPWLGDRAGGFLLVGADGSAEGASIAAMRDRDALDRTFARSREREEQRPAGTYRGIAYDVDDDVYLAPVGDFVVAGTLPALKAAIDASKGASLADEARYRDAVEPLADERLAFAYADPRLVRGALERADLDLPAAQLRKLLSSPLFEGDPATLTLTARADEIALELSADLREALPAAEGDGEVSTGELPGDAWAALATPPLGPLLRTGLASAGAHDDVAAHLRAETGLDLDRDLLDALGGLGLFARGSSVLDLGGGLLLRTTSAAAASRLVRIAQAAVAAGVGPTEPFSLAGGRGFRIFPPGSPQPVVVVARGNEIAAGYAASSALDLLDPQERFDDSEAGRAALATLGEGFTPSIVVVVPPLVDLLASLDALGVADVGQVLPYLRGYRSLAVGTQREGARQTVRIVAALRDPS